MKGISWLKVVICFVVFISLIGFTMFTLPSKAATSQSMVVKVSSGTLNVRSGPGTKYKVVGSLKNGTKVTVYNQTKSGWSEIRYSKKKAYVSTKYLQSSTPSATNGVVEVSKGTLNVRNGPGETYKRIGSFKNGSKVKVYSQTKSGWSEIRYNNKKAYVSTQYIRFYLSMSSSTAKKITDEVVLAQRETWKNDYTKEQIYSIMSPHFSSSLVDQYFQNRMQLVGKDKDGTPLYHVIASDFGKYELDSFDWDSKYQPKKPTITYTKLNGVEFLIVSQYFKDESYGNHTSTIKLYKDNSNKNWIAYYFSKVRK